MVAPLAFAAMFNLVCAGTVTGGEVPFRTTLSIDLDGKRWCAQPCKPGSVGKVAGQRDTEIVLEAQSQGTGKAATTRQITLSRETGRYIEVIQSAGKARIARGTCTAAPYTPIPRTG